VARLTCASTYAEIRSDPVFSGECCWVGAPVGDVAPLPWVAPLAGCAGERGEAVDRRFAVHATRPGARSLRHSTNAALGRIRRVVHRIDVESM
jgi:hypothetical protein